jgi:hypothetical protein
VEAQVNERGFEFHLYAVCVRSRLSGEKIYREPLKHDIEAINKAQQKISSWETECFGPIAAIPREELSLGDIFEHLTSLSKKDHRRTRKPHISSQVWGFGKDRGLAVGS